MTTSDEATRMGIAALAAAMGKAMQQRDPEFGLAFTDALDRIYYDMRDDGVTPIEVLEMVKWTGQLMERIR